MVILPGTTRLYCGKQMSLLYRNPGTGGSVASMNQEFRIDEFSYTPKVDSQKYADSLSSGYMKNTSGVFEADGSIEILLTSEGSLSNASNATNGVGVQVDDIIDIAFFTTLAQRLALTAQLTGQIHVNSVSKPFKTTDGKVGVRIDFSFEGAWTEA